MADTARPQTPTRKLFKPSLKTKTPPARKPSYLSSRPQSPETFFKKSPSDAPALFARSPGATTKLVRKRASSQASTISHKSALDEVVRSTTLAPLTSKLDASEGRLQDYAASDTNSETPIGLIDNDVLTPTDTASPSRRGTDAAQDASGQMSETMTGAAGGPPRQGSAESGTDDRSETYNGAMEDVTEELDEPEESLAKTPQNFENAKSDAVPSPKSEDEAPNFEEGKEASSGDAPQKIDGGKSDAPPPANLDGDKTELAEETSKQQIDAYESSAGPDLVSKSDETEQATEEIKPRKAPGEATQKSEDAKGDQQVSPAEVGDKTYPTKQVSPEVSKATESGSKGQAAKLADPMKEPDTKSDDLESPTDSKTDHVQTEGESKSDDAPDVASQKIDKTKSEAQSQVDSGTDTKVKDTEDLKPETAMGDTSESNLVTKGTTPTPEDNDKNPEDQLPEEIANRVEDLDEPADIAQYLEDQGFPEMSAFVRALTEQAEDPKASVNEALDSEDPKKSVTKALDSAKEIPKAGSEQDTKETDDPGTVSSNPMDELPKDDELIIKSTTSNIGKLVGDSGSQASQAQEGDDDNNNNGVSNVKEKVNGIAKTDKGDLLDPTAPSERDTTKPAALPRDTERATKKTAADKTSKALDTDDSASQLRVGSETQSPTNIDASKTNGKFKKQRPTPAAGAPAVDADADADEADRARQPGRDAKKSNDDFTPSGKKGVEGVADNMGKPERVKKRVEIPLARPERRAHGTDRRNIPEVDKLASTDGLADVDDLEDPPEEILDPEIHSPERPSANISPIPKVAKVTPISSHPPPDLFRLANGLGGHTVDDIGNIVDSSGRVLGHATGDLPAMVGKKVSNNGEIYADGGELLGYVTENFTGHPPPPPLPSNETPLPGGLSVDMEGNILDTAGNIIGRLNQKPQQVGAVAPYKGNEQRNFGAEPQKEDEKEEKKQDAIPADIFLDVKSTPDGIQLTIRIPTVFKQEQRQS